MDETETKVNKTERIHIALTPDELRAIDKWRYANEIPARSQALRELIRRGMAAPDEKKP